MAATDMVIVTEAQMQEALRLAALAGMETGVTLARQYGIGWINLMRRAADDDLDHIRNQALDAAMTRLEGLTLDTILRLENHHG